MGATAPQRRRAGAFGLAGSARPQVGTLIGFLVGPPQTFVSIPARIRGAAMPCCRILLFLLRLRCAHPAASEGDAEPRSLSGIGLALSSLQVPAAPVASGRVR